MEVTHINFTEEKIKKFKFASTFNGFFILNFLILKAERRKQKQFRSNQEFYFKRSFINNQRYLKCNNHHHKICR